MLQFRLRILNGLGTERGGGKLYSLRDTVDAGLRKGRRPAAGCLSEARRVRLWGPEYALEANPLGKFMTGKLATLANQTPTVKMLLDGKFIDSQTSEWHEVVESRLHRDPRRAA
jgi:hypothetical protein